MPTPIEFFFELSSPYSYLAATQIEALAKRTSTTCVWKPMLLGAVFKAAGNVAPATVPAKGIYMLRDLGRYSQHLDVPFTFPKAFPINAIKGHRAILAAKSLYSDEAQKTLALALYKAYWAEQKDIREDDVIAGIIQTSGIGEADAILAATQKQEIKDELRAYTEDASQRGVFGAPTFFVGDEMFWGTDRLDFVERAVLAANA